MFGLSTGFLIVFAIVAIAVLAIAGMLLAPRPKRAEKWEKAEIMKKLLALSEQEEGRRAAAAVKARPQAARPVTRPAAASLKAPSKIATPVRAKAR
jgi:chromatin segregation and condensation protein Rec8/ScpA/Scc1 (kleisin family)